MFEAGLLFLNQPLILGTLFASAIGLVLIDYLFPVDWPAYVGYALFGVFIGATVPLSVAYSGLSMVVVFGLMLLLHKTVFSRYLTNAPKHERARSHRISSSANERNSIPTPNPSLPKREGADYVVR